MSDATLPSVSIIFAGSADTRYTDRTQSSRCASTRPRLRPDRGPVRRAWLELQTVPGDELHVAVRRVGRDAAGECRLFRW